MVCGDTIAEKDCNEKAGNANFKEEVHGMVFNSGNCTKVVQFVRYETTQARNGLAQSVTDAPHLFLIRHW
jgi:hypothetical protein